MWQNWQANLVEFKYLQIIATWLSLNWWHGCCCYGSWTDVYIMQEAFALPCRSKHAWGCFVVVKFYTSFGYGQILFRTLKKTRLDLSLPLLPIWFIVAWILLQHMPGGNMSYPPAIFGRSAHGIPGLPGAFDIWYCSYRLALYRNSACPGVLRSSQPGQKRSRLLTQ